MNLEELAEKIIIETAIINELKLTETDKLTIKSQLNYVRSSKYAIKVIDDPCEEAKTLHSMLWKL